MLCLPGFLVGILTMTTTFGCCKTWSLDWRESDRAWRAMRSAQDPSIAATPIFVLKDVLETPSILAYATLLLLFGAGFLYAQKNTKRLRVLLFCTIFAILAVIRFLSSASGSIFIYTETQMLPWDRLSPLKACFLYGIINLALWNQHYSGQYSDNVAPSPSQISWRDAVIRLSYFHVLDNAIHVIWLRFFWPINNGESFTQYVNNSEILTGILLVLWWLGRG